MGAKLIHINQYHRGAVQDQDCGLVPDRVYLHVVFVLNPPPSTQTARGKQCPKTSNIKMTLPARPRSRGSSLLLPAAEAAP